MTEIKLPIYWDDCSHGWREFIIKCQSSIDMSCGNSWVLQHNEIINTHLRPFNASRVEDMLIFEDEIDVTAFILIYGTIL